MKFLSEERKFTRSATLGNKKGQFKLKDFMQDNQRPHRAEKSMSLNHSPRPTSYGLLELPNVQVGRTIMKEHTSFFQYCLTENFSIVPIMAIDFSLANLTFDDNAALHRVKTGRPNLYIDVFTHLTRLIPAFSVPFCLPFGYGAKTNPKKINEASECFAISGDFFRPEVSFHDLLSKYSTMLKSIELALPVRLGSTLRLAVDIAEEERALRRS